MKCKYIVGIFALLTLTILSCNDDLELFGEIQELPVVYGLISSSDSAQYIRVERTFADPITSAVLLAQDENQVYFSDLRVDLVNQADNSATTLTRVDAADEGYVRKTGDFLTNPNYVYKVLSSELDLTAGINYKLEVRKGDNIIAESNTSVLDESRFFAPALSGGIAKIGFIRNKETRIRWKKVLNASFYAISFDVVINERNVVSGTQELKMFRWDATPLVSDDGSTKQSQDLELSGQGFFDAFQANLDPVQDVTRQLIKLDVRVTTYGDAVGEYLDVINANSGITSAQEVPTFTNIDGGLGLFSSINETVLEDLAASTLTLDSLYNGTATADLRFTP